MQLGEGWMSVPLGYPLAHVMPLMWAYEKQGPGHKTARAVGARGKSEGSEGGG